MNTKKFFFLAIPALVMSAGLASCAPKYDVKLVVYNWDDYIYDGTDDDGNIVDKGTVKRFEE